MDYVYAFDGRGGMPLLYARKEDEPSLHSLCEYYERFQVTKKGMVLGQEPSIEELSRYMSAIDFDDAPLGSLQYALFALTAGRFYLFWHALYNDRKFIFSRGDLLAILSSKRFPITDDDARKAGNLDEFSSVQLENGVWKVRLFNYEINTGFSYVELRVCAPNSILQKSEEIVIKGSSSILY